MDLQLENSRHDQLYKYYNIIRRNDSEIVKKTSTAKIHDTKICLICVPVMCVLLCPQTENEQLERILDECILCY